MAQLIRRKGKTAGASTASVPPVDSPSVDQKTLHRRIAERAYQRFLERNQLHGHDLDDWLEAERAVLAGLRAKRPREKSAHSRQTPSRRASVSVGGGDDTPRLS